jgi:hypothetical protein
LFRLIVSAWCRGFTVLAKRQRKEIPLIDIGAKMETNFETKTALRCGPGKQRGWTKSPNSGRRKESINGNSAEMCELIQMDGVRARRAIRKIAFNETVDRKSRFAPWGSDEVAESRWRNQPIIVTTPENSSNEWSQSTNSLMTSSPYAM